MTPSERFPIVIVAALLGLSVIAATVPIDTILASQRDPVWWLLGANKIRSDLLWPAATVALVAALSSPSRRVAVLGTSIVALQVFLRLQPQWTPMGQPVASLLILMTSIVVAVDREYRWERAAEVLSFVVLSEAAVCRDLGLLAPVSLIYQHRFADLALAVNVVVWHMALIPIVRSLVDAPRRWPVRLLALVYVLRVAEPIAVFVGQEYWFRDLPRSVRPSLWIECRGLHRDRLRSAFPEAACPWISSGSVTPIQVLPMPWLIRCASTHGVEEVDREIEAEPAEIEQP